MASMTERLQVCGSELFPTLLQYSDVEYDSNPLRESDDVELSEEKLAELADYFSEDAEEAAKNVLEDELSDGKAVLVSMDYNAREKVILNETGEEMRISIEWTTPEQDAEILKERADEMEAEETRRAEAEAEAQAKAQALRQKWIDRARYLLGKGLTKEEVRQAVLMSGEDTDRCNPRIIYTLRQLGLVPSKRHHGQSVSLPPHGGSGEGAARSV